MKHASRYIPVLVIAMLLCAARPSLSQESGQLTEYYIGVHLESAGGLSAGELFNITTNFINKAMEKTGARLILKKYSSQKEVMDAFLANEIDAAQLWPNEIVEIIEKGGDPIPFATYAVDKRRRRAYCLWSKKENLSANPEDIIGKTYINENFHPLVLIQLSDYLKEIGIEEPLWNVFKSFTWVRSQNSAYMATAAGNADFYWANDDGDVVLDIISPSLSSKLGHELCTKRIFGRGTVSLNGKTVPHDKLGAYREILGEILKNMKEYAKESNDIKMLMSYLKMAGMQFIPAADREFDVEMEQYKRAIESGLLEEVQFIQKKVLEAPPGQAVTVKPDMEFCRKRCGEAGADCVLKCLE